MNVKVAGCSTATATTTTNLTCPTPNCMEFRSRIYIEECAQLSVPVGYGSHAHTLESVSSIKQTALLTEWRDHQATGMAGKQQRVIKTAII